MRDYKHMRIEEPAEPWYATIVAAIGFVALAAVLLTAPEWGAIIDGICR